MKQLSAKQKLIYIVVIAIILAGISVMCTIGFNLGLTYSNSKRIDIYIGKNFELNEIKEIANEVFDKKVVIQTAELLDDYISITVADANDEQIENLNSKINEKYNVSEKLQNSKVIEIPSTNVSDVMKPYIFPLILTTCIVAIYLAVRYRAKNILKVIAMVIASCIIIELIYFSIVAIFRIPFNDMIMPVGLLIYIITLMGNVCYLKKN